MAIAPRYGEQLREFWVDLRSVRWLHSFGAGVDTLPFDLLRKSGITVTNSRGIYADGLAEFVIAAILWFAKDLRRAVESQEAHRWEPFTVERIEGKSIGIVGYGGIGRAIGRRAEAMGMRVVPARRNAPAPEAFEADYVVLSVPLTPETRNLMSAERIAKMKPTSVLINVCRGAVVDEQALVEALRNRRIRGAALDVFQTEPLPPNHPLWSLDNVLISPHSADRTPDSHDRALELFLRNLAHFARGETLENIVDPEREY